MAADYLQIVLKGSLSELDGIAANLDFIGSAAKLVSASGGITAAVADLPDLRTIVLEFRKNSIDDFNTLRQSLYVQVFSSYEAFVRGLIRAYVDQVALKDQTYEKLEQRASILDRNIYHTGFALQQVFDNRTNTALDFSALVKNLATARVGSAAVTLNSIAFTLMLGALRPDGVIEALKRVGQNDKAIWDKFGGIKEIQQYFNLRATRETAKALNELLLVSIKRRNNIVHKGEAIEPVSENDVAELIRFFRIFFKALTDYLAAKI